MVFLNTNNKKCGLVIGINYDGDNNAKLNGCINDTEKICNFLLEKCNFNNNNIDLLTDNTIIKPTRQNIINSFRKIIKKIEDENIKEVWFSYSGHGSYLPNIKEKDYQDEALVPLDYSSNGLIRDDQIYNLFIKKIPLDCNVLCMVDACHSGTVLDLPYVYRIDTGIHNNEIKENLGNIVKISGCRDNQYSADAYINGKYQGALTFAFFKTLEEINYNFTCQQIIGRIKSYLNSNNYPQIPTLSFSKKELLNEIIMGENIEPNINIYLEGDSWCNTESSWNILNLKNNTLIFNNDKKFYCRNEKINFKIKLDKGDYLLILKDNYGDGGVVGNIKYLTNNNILKSFNFNKGTYQSINFKVNDNEIIQDSKTQVKIDCGCDYYGLSESKWNIINNSGIELFTNDITFSKSNDNIIKYLNLDKGEYYFRCMDSYGDGGIDCNITEVNTNKNILKFNWTNLNWSKENGFYKSYKFII